MGNQKFVEKINNKEKQRKLVENKNQELLDINDKLANQLKG